MSHPHDESDEELRRQISETKAQLSQKLEAFGNQASESADVATEAVSSTVESFKQTAQRVQHSVQKAGEKMDIPLQVQRHPWIAMGAAVAVGYLGYRLLSSRGTRECAYERELARQRKLEADLESGRRLRSKRDRQEVERLTVVPAAERPVSQNGHSKTAKKKKAEKSDESHGESWTSELVHGLRGMAIGALMSTVGDIASRTLPDSLKGRVTSDVEGLNRNLGGDRPPTSS